MNKTLQGRLGLLLLGCLAWGALLAVLTSPVAAQTPTQPLLLPVAQSLIVEHTAAHTLVVDQTMKVGNLPLSEMRINAAHNDVAYYRNYLRFDLTRLPPGAQIQRAALTLHVERFDYPYPTAPAPGTALPCGVYAVAEPWQPASTWAWEDNPAIITATATYTAIHFGRTGSYTVDVTGLAQGWLARQPNYGLLVGLYPDPDALAPFTAVLHGPAALSETVRPRLEIVYHAPPLPWRVYLPAILRNGNPRPDLQVEIVTPVDADDPAALQLRVANAGHSAASDFWVDLYLNPTAPPAANQPWPLLCPLYGAAWQIPLLGPGESLTLTIGGPFYSVADSQWPVSAYPVGTHTVWAYADSWGPQPWGWVNETDETNNRAGPVTFTVSATVPATPARRPATFLPRPAGGQ